MRRLFILNGLRWPARLSAKGAILACTTLFVCFPHPILLVRHLERWRDPNALIEPDAPELRPLIEELAPKMSGARARTDPLRVVQDYVYQRIEYAWDWDSWGNADYLPTVAEVIEKGKEDCDGRAVVAASLLEHFGYPSQIVTDFAHVWVKTDRGETMSPGKQRAVVATDTGLAVQPGALAALPRALAYGISPFPLERELIVLVVFWLLLLRHRGGTGGNLISLVLLVDGLLLLRIGGENHRDPIVWAQVVGLVNLLLGVGVQLIWARRHARLAALNAPCV